MSKEINNLNKSLKDQLDLNKKQDKTDNNLATTDKTIVGAINELFQSANNGEAFEEALENFQEKTDNSLKTTNKTIVGAINELFQSANNGKELIANAIGAPLNAEDTFSAMSEDITDLLFKFRTNMTNNGVTVEGGDTFNQLIDKIAIMAEEGKGIRYKSGVYSLGEIRTFNEIYGDELYEYDYQSINIPKDFDMNFVYVNTDYNFLFYDTDKKKNYEVYVTDCVLYDPLLQTLDDGTVYVFTHSFFDVYDAETGEYWNWGAWSTKIKLVEETDHIVLPLIGSYYVIPHALSSDNITFNSYYAVGLGEEDTALRDSIENTRSTLAGLMQEGGYDITGEEDIDSLLDLLILSGISVDGIKQISCGQNHTFILKKDGSIYSCGNNYYGQLGLNDTTDRNIFTKVTTNVNNDVKQIVCDGNHTFILKKDGSLWACGYNTYGQLGLGTSNTTANNPFAQVATNVKQVSCSSEYAVILKNDGSVWSCGFNSNGQLGLGDTTAREVFTQVTTNINNDVKQIDCGYNFTFIIKNDGSLWTCGGNYYGQLGLGNNGSGTNKTTFTQVGINDVKQINCGQYHTYIIKNDDSVWACGANGRGQLGLGDTTQRTTFTQTTINNVEQIACGGNTTFILKNDGSVWVCGKNDYGQLGLGDTADRTTFTQIATNAKQVDCDNYHAFILKKGDSLLACGRNDDGQLGLGDATDRTTFTQVTNGL